MDEDLLELDTERIEDFLDRYLELDRQAMELGTAFNEALMWCSVECRKSFWGSNILSVPGFETLLACFEMGHSIFVPGLKKLSG